MIEINLKRTKGNRSVQYGTLSIPRFEFRCRTLELADGSGLMYKQNCAIDTGSYQMVAGFAQMAAYFPVFKRKPTGFAKRPEINLSAGDYMHLPTGDIALGVRMTDDFTIQQSEALNEKFKSLIRDAFINKEIVVLNVYKSEKYEFEDKRYEDMARQYEDMNFIEKEDEDGNEQAELEHDAGE